ncbi:MAG: ABC transporter permease [Thermomicrobiales bacterium]|nr:ABC transporter permease [Thermomicrobiales bacterium]
MLARPEPRTGNARRAMRRFFRQKLAVLGLAVSLALIAIGLFAPLIAPTSYATANLMDANQFPSREFPFGTDAIGHDYLSRVIFGVRTSLVVGFSAVVLACAIGIPLGLLAGMRGGATDFLVLRLVEIMTAFPGILFAMFLVSITGGGVRNIVVVIGLTSWVTLCRLTRGQLLTLREQEYVQAARSLGAGEARIAWRHLLPNALPPLIVAITLAIPTAIFVEAGLSFLGIGINEPTPSLGKMVADSAQYIRIYWHLGLFPTLAIALAMLGFTFVGDGLRDALDPRLN